MSENRTFDRIQLTKTIFIKPEFSLDGYFTLFFEIDEFCRMFEPLWKERLLAGGLKHWQRQRRLSLSEVMTIKPSSIS